MRHGFDPRHPLWEVAAIVHPTSKLARYLNASFAYVKSLKPDPTKACGDAQETTTK